MNNTITETGLRSNGHMVDYNNNIILPYDKFPEYNIPQNYTPQAGTVYHYVSHVRQQPIASRPPGQTYTQPHTLERRQYFDEYGNPIQEEYEVNAATASNRYSQEPTHIDNTKQQHSRNPTIGPGVDESLQQRLPNDKMEEGVVKEKQQTHILDINTKPVDGNEFKPLILPVYKLEKQLQGDRYVWNVFTEKPSEDLTMEEEKHLQIYENNKYNKVDVVAQNIENENSNNVTVKELNLVEAHSSLFYEKLKSEVIALGKPDSCLVADVLAFKPLLTYTYGEEYERKKKNAVINPLASLLEEFKFINANNIDAYLNKITNLFDVKDSNDKTSISREAYKVITNDLTRRFNILLQVKIGNKELSVDNIFNDIQDVLNAIKSDTVSKIISEQLNVVLQAFINSLFLDNDLSSTQISDINKYLAKLHKENYTAVPFTTRDYLAVTCNKQIGYELEGYNNYIYNINEAVSVKQLHVPSLYALCSELDSKSLFNRVGYVYLLAENKIFMLSKPVCDSVRYSIVRIEKI